MGYIHIIALIGIPLLSDHHDDVIMSPDSQVSYGAKHVHSLLPGVCVCVCVIYVFATMSTTIIEGGWSIYASVNWVM